MIVIAVLVTVVSGASLGWIKIDGKSFDDKQACREFLKTPEWNVALGEINKAMQFRFGPLPLHYAPDCFGPDERAA